MKAQRIRVCVAGATGHLGVAVVKGLCSCRDFDVVAIARNSNSRNVHHLQAVGANVVFVDASKKDSYADALRGTTVAISCLAAGYQSVDSSSDFWAIDRDANIRFGREAIQSGTKHFILVATFEGRDSRNVTEFSDAKEEAVDVLKRECERFDVAFTVVRPNAYFKDLTDRAFDNVFKRGVHTVIGDGSHRINPIAREDVASFIVDCAQKKRGGGEYFVGGPDVFTFREIGVLAARVLGKEKELEIDEKPLWILRLLAFILGIAGCFYRPVRRKAALIRWMIYVSTHDAVAPCCGERRLEDEYLEKYKKKAG